MSERENGEGSERVANGKVESSGVGLIRVLAMGSEAVRAVSGEVALPLAN